MQHRIIAGVVSYNPDTARLLENISALKKQVAHILIVDNGSANFQEFSEVLPKDIIYIQNQSNKGIAAALRQIMEYAQDNKFDWVLSLDQDSVIEPGLVAEYLKHIAHSKTNDTAMYTCLIKDRNFHEAECETQQDATIEVPRCITSAALTSVAHYSKTPGYDAHLFIDGVDFDLCYSLRELGFKIVRINYLGLLHEVGKGENRKLFGKNLVVYHHSPFRFYYLSRNQIKLHNKHPELHPVSRTLKAEAKLLVRILFYEDSKWSKLKRYVKGIYHGLKSI